jgi:hypothetical protein
MPEDPKPYTSHLLGPQLDKLQHFPDGTVEHVDHPAHAKPGIHVFPDRLHVVTMLENPIRWRSRYQNYWTFQKHVEQAGAILYTAEVAFGGRDFEITDPNNPRHLQLRTNSEVWHKEQALNLMVQRLPSDWKYVAWIDADVAFARPDWSQECLHLLQRWDIIQMFSEVHNLGPDYGILTNRGSFMWNYVHNREAPHHPDFAKHPLGAIPTAPNPGYSGVGKGKWQHTGFAWAARRSAWDIMGGLIDFAILGSGDYHCATALIGNVDLSLNQFFPPRYRELCHIWQDRVRPIKNNPQGGVGYMPGAILHHFHGTTKNRSYNDRWKLLSRTGFNPDLDLKRDSQGLWILTGRSSELRDGLRAYNEMRLEDNVSVEGML